MQRCRKTVDEGERQTQSKATDGREFHFLKSPALVFLTSGSATEINYLWKVPALNWIWQVPTQNCIWEVPALNRDGRAIRQHWQDTGNGTDPYSASASPDSSSR
ncbi:unnamed protein product [Cyprideis torosa]|uniref:Uncharacterized protein n=1 Tax=Cyprideis torosa TaxID=163714 RepID=A0A7R8W3P7_9CRUS|nr:unnamed protein product [Cyprideis torosa]CAG0883258.1 unnamed protein product [Cyprideis torosa]